jgi:hypothetical protein
MARKKTQKQRKRNPNFQSVIIKRYRAARPEHYILDTDRNIYIEKVSSILPRYGKGSRGPTKWNQQISAITSLADEYDLKKTEKKSALGLARRINNVMKLVQKDDKIRMLMEHRWHSSDLFERFGYIKFADLKQSDIAKLVESYVTESGIMQLPSLATPSGTTSNQWDS